MIFRFLFIFISITTFSQTSLELKDIIYKADNRLRGKSSTSEMIITTVRPKYTREMKIKMWTEGEDYSLMYILSPSRDKGTTYLKRSKEIWYFIPSIERNIKMPPSMMNQSWMGTDLSNDDLVKKSSLANDFEHNLIKEELIDGVMCYHISLIPHDDAEVVWGKIDVWVDKVYYNIMKQEQFDEDLELVNSMVSSKLKKMDGEYIPTHLEFYPADKPHQKTIMEYISISFDVNLPDYYFTTQYMNNVKL